MDLNQARSVAAAALPMTALEIGGDPKDSPHPWRGTRRSVPRDKVPVEYGAGSVDQTVAGDAFSAGTRLGSASEFLYRPRSRSFQRRGGQTQKFDTFGSAVGALPAKWATTPHVAAGKGAKARWMEEFASDAFTDGYPTIATLLTTETIASGLDDGLFSTLWLRNQISNLNYTLGSDYNATTTYPSPGSVQNYKVVPLWYDSGAGGITRGVDEFTRRFFLSGSRRFEKVGNWWYFPSLNGTPSRWAGRAAGIGTSAIVVSSDIASYGGGWGLYGTGVPATYTAALLTDDDDTAYTGRNWPSGGASYGFDVNLTGTVAVGTTYRLTYRARQVGALTNDVSVTFTLRRSDGVGTVSATVNARTAYTTSWATYTIDITTGGGAATATANSLRVDATCALFEANYVALGYVSIATVSSSTTDANRLIPSGPLPPTHAGLLVRGTQIAAEQRYPDADTATVGSWTKSTGAAFFSLIDDTTDNDADYMQITNANDAVRVTTQNPSSTPGASDAVTVRWRAYSGVASGHNTLNVYLKSAAGTLYASGQTIWNSTTAFANYSFTITAATLAAITAAGDWNNLELEFDADSLSLADIIRVSRAYIEITPEAASAQGGWLGKHRFYYSVAYRFEDGSVWMPCDPRAPNTQLGSGYNLFTVDESNPDVHYDRITWTNVPIGPYGVIGRLLLRTTKIDSDVEDNLQLTPRDLRVVWELKDNTTTSYEDYFADDLAPYNDAEGIFIHFDHIMPPRARWIVGGVQRVLHGYGGLNPGAMLVCPVGRTADYDLNVADDASTAYNQNSMYMRVVIAASAATSYLEIGVATGAALTSTTYTFDTYDTLQKLLDKLNSTSVAVDGFQWRGQMLPGATPNLNPYSVLCPHYRELTTCVVAGQTISRVAGGLSKLAVGDLIVRAGVTTSAYVSRIDSDTQVTFIGAVTAGAVTCQFAKQLGDAPTVATTGMGYQRVIANSLPGFLYFSNDYLDLYPIEKDAVWVTSALPGTNRSAANNFSGKACKHKPPVKSGQVMGAFAVGNGFVVPCAEKIARIVSRRDGGTGEDKDFTMEMLNENHGACGFVAPGNECGFYLTPEGVCAADLEREVLLSADIWAHGSGQRGGFGDFAYEMPLCEAATAKDADAGYAHARVLRSVLHINYRASGSYPNRQVRFDFSDADDHALSGLAALKNGGWSYPLIQAFSALCVGHRSDGAHLYGWNDENAGSTGDGRVDEFETGETDNGTAIAGGYETPWIRPHNAAKISPQECVLEHSSVTGSTGAFTIHRSLADATSAMTPSTTGSQPWIRELKMYPQPARVTTAAYFLAYTQATGTARELRKLVAKHKVLPTYT